MNQVHSKPKFFIMRNDWLKLIQYARCAYEKWKHEIGGMMVVVREEAGWRLTDPVILKQETSGGNCDIDAEALAIHYGKVSDKYKGTEIRHSWWHSHHTMSAFWSGTDTDTIEGTPTPDFSVSLVINLKQEFKLRVQWFQPYMHAEDVDLHIIDKALLNDIPAVINKEVEKLCEGRTVVSTGYSHGLVQKFNHKTGKWQKAKNDAAKEEMDAWNNSYGLTIDEQPNLFDYTGAELDAPLRPSDPNYMMVYDWAEEATGKLITGEVKYKEFRQHCESSNANLKHMNNPWRIKMFKKKYLEENMFAMPTNAYVVRIGGAHGHNNIPI